MAVGRAVSELTGAPLLYNHMIIDLLTEFFPFDSDPFKRLEAELRQGVIDEAAAAGTNLLITGARPLDNPRVLPVVEQWAGAVTSRGGDALYLELRAPLAVRLERNRSPLRVAAKKLDWATDEWLTNLDRDHRWYSNGEFPLANNLVIDNTNISAEDAAALAVDHFGLSK